MEAKFQIQELLGIGMTLIVLVIGLAYGLEVTGDIQDDMGTSGCAGRSDTHTSYNESANLCYNSTGQHVPVGEAQFNATVDGITAVAKIPTKLPMIVTVIIASVVIGILVSYLYKSFA